MIPKIVVCASGEGTNFEAIVQASRSGQLKATVSGLLASRKNIGAFGRANLLDIPRKVLNPRDYAARSEWDRAMLQQLRAWEADWVVLAGFLVRVGPEVLSAFPHRIVNSHPSLLPKFGGEGMYGDYVHAAVVESGDEESGVTIHTIDGDYDRGQILAQGRVKVVKTDTAASLSDRVKTFEVSFYPKVLNDLVTGRITIG